MVNLDSIFNNQKYIKLKSIKRLFKNNYYITFKTKINNSKNHIERYLIVTKKLKENPSILFQLVVSIILLTPRSATLINVGYVVKNYDY